ncbi:GH25 family lysozyme [Liquorilactobacillus mali]|uniref:Lysin n=1 Tax=Liquorilactobacillus mali TaxID=1618 RepID=A0A0R2FVH7_9LACO|nr:GH25 family lysozyme [Liquorilactobacillus mali]KRN31643.1 Lysin [Liquorilactobacillus mali]
MRKKINGMLMGAVVMIASFLFLCSLVSANSLGIDVSNWQDSTTQYFQGFKDKGATFTIVKLGGSGGGEGVHYKNPKASAQLASASSVGLNVGGYYWGQFGSSQSQAINMANLAISDAQRVGLKTSSVIALDYEQGATSDKEANTQAIISFMETIEKANYKAVLYSGASYLRNYINVDEVGSVFGTRTWVASYKTTSLQTAPDFNYFPSMNYVAMWQYADNFYSVDGNVDLTNLMSDGDVKNNTPVKPTASNATLANNTVDGDMTYYVVKSGDSWYSIAKKFGLDMYQLAKLNGKTINTVIHPNDSLKLKGTLVNNASKTYTKTSTQLVTVDGVLGYNTILQLQKLYDMKVQDGKISNPSSLVKVLQKHLGVTQDGILGKNTINAMERKAGLKHTDGVLTRGGFTIKYIQRCINKGVKPF